jgi:hypothetical protein
MYELDLHAAAQPADDLLKAGTWAVAWTKPRREKVLSEFLTGRQVASFLPLVGKRRIYGTHVRVSHLPLFPGYVFFDGKAMPRGEILASHKVAEVLYPPDPEELRRDLCNLALALRSDDSLREARFGSTGRRVYVARGPMKGLHGQLMRYESRSRILIAVGFIGKSAELEIDEAFLEPAL